MVEKVFYHISAIPLVRVSFCGVPCAMCVYIIFFHFQFMYSSLVFYLQAHFCLSIGLCSSPTLQKSLFGGAVLEAPGPTSNGDDLRLAQAPAGSHNARMHLHKV